MTPLRQAIAGSSGQTLLYRPQTTYRVRWNMYTDTPIPQEEPAGENPPDGAMIDFFLTQEAKEITLDIVQSAGPGQSQAGASFHTIAHFSNKDTLYAIPPNNVPPYWIRPQKLLSGKAGGHRFVWDLHYQSLNVPPTYPIGATYMNTAPNPTSPWIMPGQYEVRLTVDGKRYSQSFLVKMDPRVKTAPKELQLQHDLSLQAYKARQQIATIVSEIGRARQTVAVGNKNKSLSPKWMQLDEALVKLQTAPRGSTEPDFEQLDASFASLHDLLQDSDWPPTSQMINGMKTAGDQMKKLVAQWEKVRKEVRGIE